MTEDELADAKETTEYILKESKRLEHVQALDTVKDIWTKIQEIEQKGE